MPHAYSAHSAVQPHGSHCFCPCYTLLTPRYSEVCAVVAEPRAWAYRAGPVPGLCRAGLSADSPVVSFLSTHLVVCGSKTRRGCACAYNSVTASDVPYCALGDRLPLERRCVPQARARVAHHLGGPHLQAYQGARARTPRPAPPSGTTRAYLGYYASSRRIEALADTPAGYAAALGA